MPRDRRNQGSPAIADAERKLRRERFRQQVLSDEELQSDLREVWRRLLEMKELSR